MAGSQALLSAQSAQAGGGGKRSFRRDPCFEIGEALVDVSGLDCSQLSG